MPFMDCNPFFTKVQGSRKERKSIARASPRRVRDKAAGIGINVQDIILAVNCRINKAFNFDDHGIILDSRAQTSLLHNAKLLKGLVQKVHPTQIIGISDEPIDIMLLYESITLNNSPRRLQVHETVE